MIEEGKMVKLKTYQCHECGLHYRNKSTMQKCAAWCAKYKSCNLDITVQSVEAQKSQTQ